ncbi:MAG TPA: hypothetical protein PLS55_15405, partial [Thermogutta sp.]|nr:hypothetical protein [Thermogutta sp.]
CSMQRPSWDVACACIGPGLWHRLINDALGVGRADGVGRVRHKISCHCLDNGGCEPTPSVL